MPVQLTSIVCLQDGRVLSVRAHSGFKDGEGVRAYLDGLELVEPGISVEMWPIELWTDIGDVPHSMVPVRHIFTSENGWVQY